LIWSPRQRLEVLFENASDPRPIVPVLSEPGPNNDCSARVERMTGTLLVVSCIGEKWATYENHEFLYNPHSRTMVRRIAYMPLGALQVRTDGIVMADFTQGTRTLLRVAVDAAGSPRITGPGRMLSAGDADDAYGPFHLARQKNRYGSEHAVIAEGSRFFPLPQSDQATWEAARPDDVKSFLHPDEAERNEEIGPHQWVGRNL